MPLYLPGGQTERDRARPRPPGDPQRGKHLDPERKKTTPAPLPGDRPGDRETETGPEALPAGVIAVTTARRPAAPPRFGNGRPPPNRQPSLAPPAIHLFHFSPETAPTYFILISMRPRACRSARSCVCDWEPG